MDDTCLDNKEVFVEPLADLRRLATHEAMFYGHEMNRFRSGVAYCKHCGFRVTVEVDRSVHGPALETPCTRTQL